MAVDALIGGQQPPLDGTRIGVRRQAERWRARLAAADAVGVADVAVGVEPLPPAGVVPPEGVEEAAHGDHPLVLAGRDLRPRPVDAVDLRAAGRQRREQLVGRAAVAGHEVVAVEVRLQLVVPGLGLAALERAAHDGAAAPADRRDALGRNGAGGDVGVLDDRDRRPDVGDLGHDGRDLFAQGRGGDLEDGAWIAELAAQLALDGADRRRQVVGEGSDQLGRGLHGDLRCERASAIEWRVSRGLRGRANAMNVCMPPTRQAMYGATASRAMRKPALTFSSLPSKPRSSCSTTTA